MSSRIRLSRRRVTTTAMRVVDRDGYEALTLSVVADAMGVGPSALYTHVDGLGGLRQAVAVESLRRLTHEVRDAAVGTAGEQAVHAVADAYRQFTCDHPERFAAALRAVVDTDFEDADDELHRVFVLVHSASGLAADSAHLAARSSRGAIHGFLVLEHASGRPHDEVGFGHLVGLLCEGLRGQTQRLRPNE